MAINLKAKIYECKPGMLGQVDMGKIVALIGKDLGPGVPIKTASAQKLLKKAMDGRKKGKYLNAVAAAGMLGKDLVFAITSDTDEDKAILLKDYASLKSKSQQQAQIVNADKGDRTIDKAAKDMAKAKKAKAVDDDEALDKKGDKGPIVVLAHGGSAESRGQVYAKNFARKSPKEMIQFLVKDKKLPKNYAGTLYLDGCFTAAGKTDENYAKKVYDGLKKLGYKYMTVKGNLGAAATLADGRESVLDAQEEKRLKAEAQKKIDKAKKDLKKVTDKNAKVQKIWDKVWSDKYAATNDADGFFADPVITQIQPQLQRLTVDVENHAKVVAKMKKDYKDLLKDFDDFKYDIVDLVGSFGPEKLRKHSRFKGMFK